MVNFKDIIRRIKSIVVKEYRIIEPAHKRIDQYGNSEEYKERFYNIARYLQKKYFLTQTEAINKASRILKNREAKYDAKDSIEEKYKALKEIKETEGLDSSDINVIERESPK